VILASANSINWNTFAPTIATVAIAAMTLYAKLHEIGTKVDGRLDEALTEVKAGRKAIDSLQGVVSSLTGVPAPPTLEHHPTPTASEIAAQGETPKAL
jgi:hypothetical protein